MKQLLLERMCNQTNVICSIAKFKAWLIVSNQCNFYVVVVVAYPNGPQGTKSLGESPRLSTQFGFECCGFIFGLVIFIAQ
jgi:hypothetical protein